MMYMIFCAVIQGYTLNDIGIHRWFKVYFLIQGYLSGELGFKVSVPVRLQSTQNTRQIGLHVWKS